MPSILSQAVMGGEKSPQRQTDGQTERALCLESQHRGERAEPGGERRESLAGHSQPHGLRHCPRLAGASSVSPLGMWRLRSWQGGHEGPVNSNSTCLASSVSRAWSRGAG